MITVNIIFKVIKVVNAIKVIKACQNMSKLDIAMATHIEHTSSHLISITEVKQC